MLQIECTYFFEENPFALETKESLATRLGRSANELEPILSNLVALSVLTKFGEGEDTVYRYNQPIMINEKLEV
jgi:hypothetical protein